MTSFLTWQRLPVGAIRIIRPDREARLALLFALGYIAASFITGLVERTWPMPLWGASTLTSDATYVVLFKIGLLLVVPALAIRRAGYTRDDVLLGWRATPRAVFVLVVLFVLGALINAGTVTSIRSALVTLSPSEGALRVAVGWLLMFFCAALPEEVVYRWGLQTRLERVWGRLPAIIVAALLFTAWHLPSRYLLATGAEGKAGDLVSVLVGTGLPVFVVGLIFGWAWDRWRNLPALVFIHWGIDTLPSVASFLKIPMGGH